MGCTPLHHGSVLLRSKEAGWSRAPEGLIGSKPSPPTKAKRPDERNWGSEGEREEESDARAKQEKSSRGSG